MSARHAICIGLLLTCAKSAHAQPEALSNETRPCTRVSGERTELPETVERGWLPAVTSVIPGVVLHGSGHFAAGDHATAGKLVALQGVGLLGLAGAFVPLAATGASRHFVGPLAALAVASGGAFVVSWLADLYGVATGDTATGEPQRVLPPLEVEVGYAAVHDPLFDYSHFAVLAADLRSGRWRASPSGWLALDDENQRVRLEGAYRFLGPAGPSLRAARDGSYLELESAFTFHRYGPQGFEVLTWELAAGGRYDMGRYAESLRGSFAELSLGVGFELYGYSAASLPLGEDFATLLLGRFGYGIYIGRPDLGRGGEVTLYYDHRHDRFASGVSFDSLGDGVAGFFGVQALYRLTRRWALTLDLQAGSAYLGRLGVRFRPGGAG